MVWWALWLGLSDAVACDSPVSPAELGQAISVGEAAYMNMDEASFRSAWVSVQEMVPCLSGPVGSSQVVSFYRMAALHAFLERDEAAGVSAFRALLARSPRYSLSPSLAPEDHPLQTWRTTAFESPAVLTSPVSLPRNGTVWVDGVASSGTVPVDRPYILQQADRDGEIELSVLVYPGQEPPSLGGGGMPVRAAYVSVGAALLAGGSYALARRGESVFLDPATPTGDLASVRQRTNSLSAVSIGAGVTAVGAGALAVYSRTW